MIYYNRKKSDDHSIMSDDSSSTFKSVWNRLSHIFQLSQDTNRRLSTSSNDSNSSTQSHSSLEQSTRHPRSANRKKKLIVVDDQQRSSMMIPPYSPTYCRPNEFPYSNFYVKLPNGKWMVRYRSGNRDILGTDEFEGYMI
jgi:hypothetical protein